MHIIGRKEEQIIFDNCLAATESKLIAVYGRRRVGKTFLIREYFQQHILFEIAGLHNGSLTDQLLHFKTQLIAKGLRIKKEDTPTTWMESFALLGTLINNKKNKQKKVIFIDELPWFDTPKSKFLMAFENFWNSFCTNRKDIILVICGSAAAWMIQKIVKNKGGLHNRISEKINLQPFTLAETESFLKKKMVKWSRFDITQLYMITGGIPFYINAVLKTESLPQSIDRICFSPNGMLYSEFIELYSSLFEDSAIHYQIIKLLYQYKAGLTRTEIFTKLKIKSGGSITAKLHELEQSGFVASSLPFQNNSSNSIYKLKDYFTIFYLKFMQDAKAKGKGTWLKKSVGSSWLAWSGVAFETICLHHIQQIKNALQLQAIYTETTSWRGSYAGNGAQIDIVINRADRVINICEVKFSNAPFIITKAYAHSLRNKINIFKQQPLAKNKNIFFTTISVHGITNNLYAKELIQNQIVLDDLFIN